jgi:competence protein ComEC
VTFIDVGQGDAILIQTEGRKAILIDGGGIPPYYSGDFDTGDDIIQPFLYSKGIKKIDVVVFTHFDDDHARGLLSILRSMKVKNIIYGVPEDCNIYEEMVEIARQKQIKTIQVKRGEQFTFDNITFDVLNPVGDTQKNFSSNDNSVVLKMSYKGFDFLFTGDLEYEGERSLISSGIDIGAHVLKVGHHGSHTSTSRHIYQSIFLH